jgi:hypothetical protein
MVGTKAGWIKAHSYVFEVPALAEDEVPALSYPALGRFAHAAISVDAVGWRVCYVL